MTDAAGPLGHLLCTDVEVYAGTDRGREPRTLMGKGRVIAVCYEPTIVLLHEDGTQSHHVASLPRVEYRPHRVGLAAGSAAS